MPTLYDWKYLHEYGSVAECQTLSESILELLDVSMFFIKTIQSPIECMLLFS